MGDGVDAKESGGASMNCQTCGAENREGRKPRAGCGGRSTMVCPKCPFEAERKQVTVLFARVKGSMELASASAP